MQILSQGPDGVIEARIYSAGTTVAEVVRKPPEKPLRHLGVVKVMIDNSKGLQTLQARCRVHSKCICWLSNCNHTDLLLQWLSKGDSESHEEHQVAATELKRSTGMKVRSKIK